MPTRRTFLIGLGAAVASCGGGRPSKPTWTERGERALERGVAALWGLQAEDGAFRSSVHGLLGDGWSLTPFALLALIRAGRPLRADGASRALGWIAHGTRDGVLGLASVAPDYPCYATALALHCFASIRPPDPDGTAEALRRGLRSLQLRAADGWDGHAAAGGFRMGSVDVPRPPNPGHVDLSMTRRAVEALVASGVPASDPAIREAVGFARRCRTPGGTFVYTATETALNKGRRAEDPGYGSATADGLLLCAAAGEGGQEQGLGALRAMHRTDENPLVGENPGLRPYARAMRGYYRCAAARVFAARGGPEGWREALVEAIVAEQREDGSWANEQVEQKEDEPVVATGFALTAISSALDRSGSGKGVGP